MPTPAQKAAFAEAATPVYDWFKDNVARGPEIFDALTVAVSEAETEVNASRAADLN